MYMYVCMYNCCRFVFTFFGKAFFVMDILHALFAYVREMFMR